MQYSLEMVEQCVLLLFEQFHMVCMAGFGVRGVQGVRGIHYVSLVTSDGSRRSLGLREVVAEEGSYQTLQVCQLVLLNDGIVESVFG